VLSFEFVHKVVDQAVVEVLTTQVSVSGGRLDFKDTLFNGQEGDIEGTTTEIEDENIALANSLLVKTIGNGSGGGFVDNTEDIETGNETGVFCGLPLTIVKVRRDCDDSVVDSAAEV
jgi:hypothetical protein